MRRLSLYDKFLLDIPALFLLRYHKTPKLAVILHDNRHIFPKSDSYEIAILKPRDRVPMKTGGFNSLPLKLSPLLFQSRQFHDQI